MRTRHIFLAVALMLCMAAPAGAAPVQPKPATAAPDTPARIVERRTAVAVVHDGTDSIGARLATRLKERFNSSNLFQLTEKDGPKIILLLSSTPEFNERPGLGSVYSLTWTFSQNENHLSYLLTREVGAVSPDKLEDLVNTAVARTDGLAVKYGYLFQ